MLTVGSLQYHIDRNRCRGIHGFVGYQSRLYIDDQFDNVHWILRGLHGSHLLRLHGVESEDTRRKSQRMSILLRTSHSPRFVQHNPGGRSAIACGQLHLFGLLQNGLHGHILRRDARLIPAASFTVAVRARVLHEEAERDELVGRGEAFPAPVLLATPAAGAQRSDVQREGREPERRVQGLRRQGPGHRHLGRGHEREQLQPVAAQANRERRELEEEVRGRLEAVELPEHQPVPAFGRVGLVWPRR